MLLKLRYFFHKTVLLSKLKFVIPMLKLQLPNKADFIKRKSKLVSVFFNHVSFTRQNKDSVSMLSSYKFYAFISICSLIKLTKM